MMKFVMIYTMRLLVIILVDRWYLVQADGINPVLYDYFKDDIKLMSKIMDRDLAHWLAGKGV